MGRFESDRGVYGKVISSLRLSIAGGSEGGSTSIWMFSPNRELFTTSDYTMQ